MQLIADAGWRFDNSFARLPEPFFTSVRPTPVRAPRIVVVNAPLAADLGLDAALIEESGADILAGNALPPGAEPIAQAYAGHQFGHFTNLGDGRAILLGEQITPNGRRVDVQLKGAGRTRYSRGGDGRAALGPMLREYVVSEGMHALGIPTTRSLAVTATGEAVLRTAALPGAVLARIAESHIRVGTFQYAAVVGGGPLLAPLLDYAIARHDAALAASADRAVAFLDAVVERQAALVARWMLVGFVHGVMNTDNMAVSGETIDYGPCAFLDVYDPETVFSSIDQHGRYAYGNQPGIAQWNLVRFAESLLPLVSGDEAAAVEAVRSILETFPARYERHRLAGGREKLGLATEEDGDRDLFEALLRWMQETGADFTATFAGLARLAESDVPPEASGFRGWWNGWRARLAREPGPVAASVRRMRAANPSVIPRNHHVEQALAAAESGDLSALHGLLAAVRDPFVETPANEPYRAGPPPGTGCYRTFCGT